MLLQALSNEIEPMEYVKKQAEEAGTRLLTPEFISGTIGNDLSFKLKTLCSKWTDVVNYIRNLHDVLKQTHHDLASFNSNYFSIKTFINTYIFLGNI